MAYLRVFMGDTLLQRTPFGEVVLTWQTSGDIAWGLDNPRAGGRAPLP